MGWCQGSCPSAGRTVIESSVQSGGTRLLCFFKKKKRNRKKWVWGPLQRAPPEIIQGHYRLLSDLVCIYDIEIGLYIHTHWDCGPQDGFLQHVCVIGSGPWSLVHHYCPGTFHPDILQYFTGRICTFLVSPL